jgi:RNA ligase (TIGR02306 family)
MSSLIVEVCRIESIASHPSADRLEIATIKGWKVVVGLGSFKKGDVVVFFPPDTALSQKWTDSFGITKYCSPWKGEFDEDNIPFHRIRAARLRGQASFGTVIPTPELSWEVGKDVAAYYGARKWEPPVKPVDGNAAPEVPGFHKYTDMENLNNYPEAFVNGEEVVISEKIHGRSQRLGLIRLFGDEGPMFTEFMAGSHNVRRKEFDVDGKRSLYWEAMTDNTMSLLSDLGSSGIQVMLFGELYGSAMQDLQYSMSNGKRAFAAFDISVDGRYLDYDEFVEACEAHQVPTVNLLYRGPYSREVVDQYTDGPTTMCDPDKAGTFKGREGVVVRPVKESTYWKNGGETRKILKSISVDYLTRKNPTEDR